MTIAEKMQRRIQEMSVELCREMYGEDECPPLGTRFSQIEDDAVTVADTIGREVMQNLLARQAAQVPQAALSCRLFSLALLGRRSNAGAAFSKSCFCQL